MGKRRLPAALGTHSSMGGSHRALTCRRRRSWADHALTGDWAGKLPICRQFVQSGAYRSTQPCSSGSIEALAAYKAESGYPRHVHLSVRRNPLFLRLGRECEELMTSYRAFAAIGERGHASDRDGGVPG